MNPEHVLQLCPLFKRKQQSSNDPRECFTVLPPRLFREARRQQWLYGATLQEQLLGNTEDLLKATTFIKIKTKHNHHKIIREREREREREQINE